MALTKVKKRKKSIRMRGGSTHGGGARKKRKKSGHRGGSGMSGTGKRGDHKKTLVTKLYGNKYFGKRGITSKGTVKDKRDRINLRDIEKNIEKYGKKSGDSWNVELKAYKILGGPKGYVVKNKMIISAGEASKGTIEHIKKVGGEVILPKKVVNPKSKK
ncbi:MAG: uL15m family ribosomal protein [Nanoarchaeota archaeon]|nr:uL15m family ribosomal protein [Nanoarchaeota archaeon]